MISISTASGLADGEPRKTAILRNEKAAWRQRRKGLDGHHNCGRTQQACRGRGTEGSSPLTRISRRIRFDPRLRPAPPSSCDREDLRRCAADAPRSGPTCRCGRAPARTARSAPADRLIGGNGAQIREIDLGLLTRRGLKTTLDPCNALRTEGWLITDAQRQMLATVVELICNYDRRPSKQRVEWIGDLYLAPQIPGIMWPRRTAAANVPQRYTR